MLEELAYGLLCLCVSRALCSIVPDTRKGSSRPERAPLESLGKGFVTFFQADEPTTEKE